MPILRRDLLSKFKASVTIPNPPPHLAWLLLLDPTFSLPLSLPSLSANPIVWDTDNHRETGYKNRAAMSKAGIKIARRNINNLRYADDTTLMAESEEELKNFLMKVKEKSEKDGLKLNIQKTKIMASSPITSWQIDGETMKTVRDFILGGLQNHCRW